MTKPIPLAEATIFCAFNWMTPYGEEAILSHSCYLNRGHEGPHACGDCCERPVEMHRYFTSRNASGAGATEVTE